MASRCSYDCPRVKAIQAEISINSTFLGSDSDNSHINSSLIQQLLEIWAASDDCEGPRNESVEKQVGFFSKHSVTVIQKLCGLTINSRKNASS